VLKSLLDKIVFGVLLIACLQLPLIADHYLQFLSGFHRATVQQVSLYESNALQHNYKNAEAMINALLTNQNAAIRTDAAQKLNTINSLKDQEAGLTILKEGHFFERIGYILAPSRHETLRAVLINFKIGLPLTLADFGMSALIATLLSQLLWFASYLIAKAIRRGRTNTLRTSS
jgi:hypothetical protein